MRPSCSFPRAVFLLGFLSSPCILSRPCVFVLENSRIFPFQYTSFVGVVSILYTMLFVVKRSIDGTYSEGGEFFKVRVYCVCSVCRRHVVPTAHVLLS